MAGNFTFSKEFLPQWPRKCVVCGKGDVRWVTTKAKRTKELETETDYLRGRVRVVKSEDEKIEITYPICAKHDFIYNTVLMPIIIVLYILSIIFLFMGLPFSELFNKYSAEIFMIIIGVFLLIVTIPFYLAFIFFKPVHVRYSGLPFISGLDNVSEEKDIKIKIRNDYYATKFSRLNSDAIKRK